MFELKMTFATHREMVDYIMATNMPRNVEVKEPSVETKPEPYKAATRKPGRPPKVEAPKEEAPKVEAPKDETEAATASAGASDASASAKPLTLDDVKAQAMKVTEKFGQVDGMAKLREVLLAHEGTKLLRDLKPAHFQSVFDKCGELLK